MDCGDCKYEKLLCDEKPCCDCWSKDYWEPKDDILEERVAKLEKKLEANLKARLPDADWRTVNENFIKMSLRIEQLETENQMRSTETSKLMEKYAEINNALSELKERMTNAFNWLIELYDVLRETIKECSPHYLIKNKLLKELDLGKKDWIKEQADGKQQQKEWKIRECEHVYTTQKPFWECGKCGYIKEDSSECKICNGTGKTRQTVRGGWGQIAGYIDRVCECQKKPSEEKS